MESVLQYLKEPAMEVLNRAAQFLPVLVGVVVILIVGWIVAKVLEGLVIKVLKMIKFDLASEKAGIAAFLQKGNVKRTLSELVGALVYWVIMLIVLVMAFNAMNLPVAAALLDKVAMYIPVVIASIFILVLGIFFATLVGSIVTAAAANAGIAMANGLGKLSQIIIVVFASVMALTNLNIAAGIVQMTLTIVLASLGLGLALAIGLGCKDLVSKYVNEWVNKLSAK